MTTILYRNQSVKCAPIIYNRVVSYCEKLTRVTFYVGDFAVTIPIVANQADFSNMSPVIDFEVRARKLTLGGYKTIRFGLKQDQLEYLLGHEQVVNDLYRELVSHLAKTGNSGRVPSKENFINTLRSAYSHLSENKIRRRFSHLLR